jgi:hypothetical protein
MVIVGRLRGTLSGPGAKSDPLAPFLRSVWRTRLSVRAGRARRAVDIGGLAYATFERVPGAACVKLHLRTRGRRRTGTLRVTGGTGAASRLAATARFRFRANRRGQIVLRGVIRRRAAGRRPIGRGCRALERLRR